MSSHVVNVNLMHSLNIMVPEGVLCSSVLPRAVISQYKMTTDEVNAAFPLASLCAVKNSVCSLAPGSFSAVQACLVKCTQHLSGD